MSASPKSERAPLIERRKPGDPRPISFTQRRLWYLEQLTPGTGVYNVPYVVRISGPLKVEALQKSFDAVIGRHEVLRSVFLAPGGSPTAVPLKKWNFELKQYDVRAEADRQSKAQDIVD